MSQLNLGCAMKNLKEPFYLKPVQKRMSVMSPSPARSASRLMRRDYAPAWRLCMQVARRMNNEYSSGVEKERLLAFALIYADRDCLASLLGDWQTAQTNEM